MQNAWKLSLTALVVLIGTGCGRDEPPPPPAEPESTGTEQRMERERPRYQRSEPVATPEVQMAPTGSRGFLPSTRGLLEDEGLGLSMLIDGSSAQAFHQSLQNIARDTSAEQYDQLTRALQYLRMYDNEALRGNDALIFSLDGQTGLEVIARAEALRRERGQQP